MMLLGSDVRLGTELCRNKHQTHSEKSAEKLQCMFSSSARLEKASSVCSASPSHSDSIRVSPSARIKQSSSSL